MKCPNCGNILPDNSIACNMCGCSFNTIVQNQNMQSQQQAVMMQNPYGANMVNNSVQNYSFGNQSLMTKEMFFKSPGVSKFYKRIKDAGISAYILGGISLISALTSGSIFVFIPILFILFVIGMGCGIHLACSRVCAILLLIFSSIYVLLCLVTIHFPSGLLLLIDGIYATKATNDIQNAYNTYVMSNGAKFDFNS